MPDQPSLFLSLLVEHAEALGLGGCSAEDLVRVAETNEHSTRGKHGPLRPPWTCMGMIFGTRPQPRVMSSKFSDDFRKMDPCKSKVKLK